MGDTMNKNELKWGDPYADIMGISSSLLERIRMKNARLTPEERQANTERYERLQEERRIKTLIIQNICPSCENKLVRGKKDKKKDYKRDWKCGSCNDVFSL